MLKGRATFFKRVRLGWRIREIESRKVLELSLLIFMFNYAQGGVLLFCWRRGVQRDPLTSFVVFGVIFRDAQPEISGAHFWFECFAQVVIL